MTHNELRKLKTLYKQV